MLGGGEGRKYENFLSNIVLSHMAENFVKKPFSASSILGIEILGINRKNIRHDRNANPEATA